MSSLIVTMDTGGSKTLLNLCDISGEIIREENCVGVGVLNEADAKIDELEAAIFCLMKGYERADVLSVVGNVGGTNNQQLTEVMQKEFPKAKVEIFRESSGVLMADLCRLKKIDAILMAGTGSIALAIGDNGSVITDGWSPYLGDGGSGFWIGMQAIRRSLRMLESKLPLSPLVKELTGREEPFSPYADVSAQMPDRDKIRGMILPLERKKVAAITKRCAEYARAGDDFSKEIFRDAGEALADTVLRAVITAGGKDSAGIMVTGGLVGCADLWSESFDKRIKRENENYSWQTGEINMIEGALYHALSEFDDRR